MESPLLLKCPIPGNVLALGIYSMYPLFTLFTPLRGSHLYLVFTADLLGFPLVELEDATEESCTGDDGGGGSPGQHQPH